MARKKKNPSDLPNQLKISVETLSGLKLDEAKVHYNSSKPAQLDLSACTQGEKIHLAAKQEAQLPREAWHVVQQKQGRVKPTKQSKSATINDDSALEKEADDMGEKANGK